MMDVVRKALYVAQGFLALGNERFEAAGATFIRNRALPEMRDANLVTRIMASTPSEVSHLFSRVEREFEGFPYRCIARLDFTTPPLVEAALALGGYTRTEDLLLLLEGDLVSTHKQYDIRPLTDNAGWDAYAALHQIDWREYAARVGESFDGRLSARYVEGMRAKSPPVDHWMAYVEGQPRGYCSSWVGIDGIGMIEDLFVQTEFRHRGIATALLHHCVSNCRDQGAEKVIIMTDTSDTPKHMYAAMGFRPIAVTRNYWKMVGSP